MAAISVLDSTGKGHISTSCHSCTIGSLDQIFMHTFLGCPWNPGGLELKTPFKKKKLISSTKLQSAPVLPVKDIFAQNLDVRVLHFWRQFQNSELSKVGYVSRLWNFLFSNRVKIRTDLNIADLKPIPILNFPVDQIQHTQSIVYKGQSRQNWAFSHKCTCRENHIMLRNTSLGVSRQNFTAPDTVCT